MAEQSGASIPATALVVFLGGAVLLYSGIKGNSVSAAFRTLLQGDDPSTLGQSNPITGSNSGGTTPDKLVNGGTPATNGTGGAIGAGAAATGKRADVVAYAKAQLGKPYRFAAAGPNAFDCSGLTMMAWRAGGVPWLTHYTVTQYAQTKHIPMSQAQPGDIILVSSNKALTAAPHHVILYIGNGQAVDAFDEGVPVKISNVSSYNDEVLTVGQFPG